MAVRVLHSFGWWLTFGLFACNGGPVLGDTEPLANTDDTEPQHTGDTQATDTDCGAAFETCNGEDDDCDGLVDEGVAGTAFCPAVSCAVLLQERPDSTDGVYSLDPESDGIPADYTCDMSTDGGGWTQVMSVDGALGQDAVFAEWPVSLSNSTIEDEDDHIRWFDGDQTGDVHVMERTVEVPNDGGVRVSLDFTLVGPDNSGFFVWLDDNTGTRTPLACQDDTNEGGAVWESWEWDAIPFSCEVEGEDTVVVALEHDTPLADAVRTLGLATFIVDKGGDEAQLYAAELWVR